jgi:flavin-dependent dehydrogenase
VVEVSFDAQGVRTTVQDADGERRAVRARAIIDGSGRGALLSRKFDLRIDEPRLANVAVFSHYSGVPRQEGRRSGDIRIVARDDLGWFWLIPISGELMSVGVVLPSAAMKALPTLEHGELLDRMIAGTPAVARLLAMAQRQWPVRVEKDFSFGSRAYAGDRWMLAGDAGSFLDPVFSTGVAIALESGLEAGRAMADGLAAGDLSARRFAAYARRQRQRYTSFRRFVLGFYTAEFRDLFFAENPAPRMFRALVTVFAGYWRPTVGTRIWVALFFLLVRLQRVFGFAPRLALRAVDAELTKQSSS